MRTIVILFLLGFQALTLHAQTAKTKPFTLGITAQIHSEVLGEERPLNIYLPDGYSKDSSYPVIYLLDGSANEDFVHVCGIAQFLNMIGYMPPTVIIGIANTNRHRDFTFPTTVEEDKKKVRAWGGAAKFISFVEKELVPYINKNYKVRGTTLIGQSLGGLMAAQILLEKPPLFNTYIIVSPSLWWDNGSLLARTPHLLKATEAAKATVYISAGGVEEDFMQRDAEKLSILLQQQKNLTVMYLPEAKESHLTILHNCLYNAFMTLNEKKT